MLAFGLGNNTVRRAVLRLNNDGGIRLLLMRFKFSLLPDGAALQILILQLQQYEALLKQTRCSSPLCNSIDEYTERGHLHVKCLQQVQTT